MNPAAAALAPVLTGRGLRKAYGPTVAVDGVDLDVAPGEVIGLVGANGAGKSTLMRILSGVTAPEEGSLVVAGSTARPGHYGPTRAATLGVRVVYQELSLATNLTVYENFYVEQSQRFRGLQRWRHRAREVARASLDAVFPGNGIDEGATVSGLTIAQQQMVEIARATSDLQLRVLILDEPTSSLGAEQSEQLHRYLAARRAQGVSFVFISHRLSEVLRISGRILVMRNGALVWTGAAAGALEAELVERMSGGRPGAQAEDVIAATPVAGVAPTPAGAARAGLVLEGLRTDVLRGLSLDLSGGQMVGLAGLDGSGQRELLRAIFSPPRGAGHAVRRHGRVAFVTGDRKKEGIFPLWSIASNMDITAQAARPIAALTRPAAALAQVRHWYHRLAVKGDGVDAGITSLSGGNQQKVLIARALMADADVILLDDPTRGVDIGTKRQLYALFAEAAREGKLIVWYSTEDEELAICDRVFVLRFGQFVSELARQDATKERIIQASFSNEAAASRPARDGTDRRRSLLGNTGIPLAAMVLVYLLSGLLSPAVFSGFGLGLLVGGAIPLVLAALAQMFVIGLSQVDLGVGAFMGLVNVLGATTLQKNPPLGVACLAAGLALYAGMGALIHYRRIPAIIVTLGASFVWTGVAYTLQSMPGGQAPPWLVSVFAFELPLVPQVVVIALAVTLLAHLLHRSRYGTVLRGFGNNPLSMQRSGWSPARAFMVGYLLAGLFALLGGLAITAITTGSDANATGSYTLLTVAAVVMGGGALTGGVVYPFGALFGAITLSLIGSLLGFLDVSSSYVAAVQGFILLLILALRLLRKEAFR